MNRAEATLALACGTDPNGTRMARMRRIFTDFSAQDYFSKSENLRLLQRRAHYCTDTLIPHISI